MCSFFVFRFSFFFLSFFLSLIYPLFDNAVLFAANIVWRHFPLWTIIMKTSKVKFSERLTFLGQHSAWTYLPGNKSNKLWTNYEQIMGWKLNLYLNGWHWWDKLNEGEAIDIVKPISRWQFGVFTQPEKTNFCGMSAVVIKFNRYILLPKGPFCVALTKVGHFKIWMT